MRTDSQDHQRPRSRIRRVKYKVAPWLVMIYLAGDNNLTEEMVMSSAGVWLAGRATPVDDKIMAQFDPSENGAGDSAIRFGD